MSRSATRRAAVSVCRVPREVDRHPAARPQPAHGPGRPGRRERRQQVQLPQRADRAVRLEQELGDARGEAEVPVDLEGRVGAEEVAVDAGARPRGSQERVDHRLGTRRVAQAGAQVEAPRQRPARRVGAARVEGGQRGPGEVRRLVGVDRRARVDAEQVALVAVLRLGVARRRRATPPAGRRARRVPWAAARAPPTPRRAGPQVRRAGRRSPAGRGPSPGPRWSTSSRTAGRPSGATKVFSGDVDGRVPSVPSGSSTSQSRTNRAAPSSTDRSTGVAGEVVVVDQVPGEPDAAERPERPRRVAACRRPRARRTPTRRSCGGRSSRAARTARRPCGCPTRPARRPSAAAARGTPRGRCSAPASSSSRC